MAPLTPWRWWALAVLLLVQPETRAQTRPSGGPWENDVDAYHVGADGRARLVGSFQRAGVPTIARMKDGRLIAAHQYFPEGNQADFDKVAVYFSSDEGESWTVEKVIEIKGLPEGMRFPFDPTLVPLPDGRVRLYFTGNYLRPKNGPGQPAIHSAVSTDGVTYVYEEGVRFAVEGRPVIDCAVVLHRGVFHLFAPDNGTTLDPRQAANLGESDRPKPGVGYHATSEDGLRFTRRDDVKVDGRRSWLGAAVSEGDAIRFYGTGQGLRAPGQSSPGGIWTASSQDGLAWQLVVGPAVGGADPGVVALKDGGLYVIATSPPRRGTRAKSHSTVQPAAR